MADKIKKFFAKKKADAKFKLAGPGHKLNETATTTSNSHIKVPKVVKRSEPSAEARQAADAALTRLQSNKRETPFNTSLAAIQAQVRRELEAEKKAEQQQTRTHEVRQGEIEASPVLACQGVYFKCPMVSAEILTKDEWKIKIKDFLYEQLEEERGLTACLIIQSCNSNRDKVKLQVSFRKNS